MIAYRPRRDNRIDLEVIFTASRQEYADRIIDHMDIYPYVDKRFFRDDCIQTAAGFYVSQSWLLLSILNNLQKILQNVGKYANFQNLHNFADPIDIIFKMSGRHRMTMSSNEKPVLLESFSISICIGFFWMIFVPFESAWNALQNDTKIMKLRYILILKTIPKVLVSHSMASSLDGGRASLYTFFVCTLDGHQKAPHCGFGIKCDIKIFTNFLYWAFF